MQTRPALLSGGASTLIAPASCSTETSHQSPFIATILMRFCRSMQRCNLVDAVPQFVERDGACLFQGIVVGLGALTVMGLGTPSRTKTSVPDPFEQLTVDV